MVKKKTKESYPRGLRPPRADQPIDEVKIFVKKGEHVDLTNFLVTLFAVMTKSEFKIEPILNRSNMLTVLKVIRGSIFDQYLAKDYLELCAMSLDYLDSSLFNEQQAQRIENLTQNVVFKSNNIKILQYGIDLSSHYERNNRGPINASLIWGQLLQYTMEKFSEKHVTQNILNITYRQMCQIYPPKVLLMSKFILCVCWGNGDDLLKLERQQCIKDIQEECDMHKKSRQQKSFNESVLEALEPSKKKKICSKKIDSQSLDHSKHR